MSEQTESQSTEATENVEQEVQQEQVATEQPEQSATEATEANKPEVPESYEFQPPEGLEFDQPVIDEFAAAAKEIGLSQENASAIVNRIAPIMAQRQAEQAQQQAQLWAEEAQSDKEFGGERLGENLASAKKALDTYGSDNLKSLLDESGLGNHPEVIRFMWKVGQTLNEDTIAGGGQEMGQRDARALYPNTQLNP